MCKKKSKVIILDDNPFSIACYLQEYGDKLSVNQIKKEEKP